MKQTYIVGGMSCMSCVAKVESAILSIPDVLSTKVDKASDTATIEMDSAIPLHTLQNRLKSKDPKYSIQLSEDKSISNTEVTATLGLSQYKPIFIIFAYIASVTLIVQYINGSFDMLQWMRHFMAGFFLTFSFFKMLDISGFANSYLSYDIIAKRWKGWGYVYAFIELGLGLAYLSNCCALATNIVAFIVMTISIIGVLQSVLNKKKIQCACLGAVFDLPMSTVTIIEDALMIIMSGYMIFQLI